MMKLLVVVLLVCGAAMAQYEDDAAEVLPKNLCSIEKPLAVFCYCDYENLGKAKLSTCWVYGVATEDDKAWDYFQTQPMLKSLEIYIRSDGVLQFIPTAPIQQLPQLEFYEIQHSNITVVDRNQFRGGHGLKSIKLNNNNISQLRPGAFRNLKKLETISLSRNMISKIVKFNFAGLPNLKYLYIDRNNVSAIEGEALMELEKLEELELYRNSLQNLSGDTFLGLVNLRRLDISYNQLEYLNAFIFRDQAKLEQLILSNNRIRFISEDAFTGLSSLTTLNLEDNKLTGLGGELLKSTPAIHYLNLRQNVLETLTSNFLEPIKENFLNNSMIILLSGNNVMCDCRISWMYDVIENRKTSSLLRNNLDRLHCFLSRQAAAKIIPDTEITEASSAAIIEGRYPVFETSTHSLGFYIRLFDIPKEKLPCELEKSEPCITDEEGTVETKSLDTRGETHKHKKEHRRHGKHRNHERGKKKERRRKNKEDDDSSETIGSVEPTYGTHHTENASHETIYRGAELGTDSNLNEAQYTDSQDPKPIKDSSASSHDLSLFLLLLGLFLTR